MQRENISSRFLKNSEAFASEFLRNFDEIFPRYYIRSELYKYLLLLSNQFNFLLLCYPSREGLIVTASVLYEVYLHYIIILVFMYLLVITCRYFFSHRGALTRDMMIHEIYQILNVIRILQDQDIFHMISAV